ncbi:MAG: hypothetical protein WEA56_07610 [Balneolaceae bacterium]
MATSKKEQTIGFDYIKSNFHREIYADGVHGGVTPRGKVQISFYNERNPIPTHSEHKVVNNRIGGEIREKRQSRDAIIRIVETTVILDASTLQSLIGWMQEKIDFLKEEKKKIKNEES